MQGNVKIINLTGREIQFDWVQFLRSSPLFTKDAVNPDMWTMKGTASIALGPETLYIHPGLPQVIERVLQDAVF